jgi:hypothetical protein
MNEGELMANPKIVYTPTGGAEQTLNFTAGAAAAAGLFKERGPA